MRTKDEIEKTIENDPMGTIYYPKLMAKEYQEPVSSVYTTLQIKEQDGLLTSRLEPLCPNCNQYYGTRYDGFFDLPKSLVCPSCGKSFDDLFDAAVVVFVKN